MTKDSQADDFRREFLQVVAPLAEVRTRPLCSRDEVLGVTSVAVERGYRGVAVTPNLVDAVRQQLEQLSARGSQHITAIIGEPYGCELTLAKAFGARAAIDHGATQIELVLDPLWCTEGRWSECMSEIVTVREAVPPPVHLRVRVPQEIGAEKYEHLCTTIRAAGADGIVVAYPSSTSSLGSLRGAWQGTIPDASSASSWEEDPTMTIIVEGDTTEEELLEVLDHGSAVLSCQGESILTR